MNTSGYVIQSLYSVGAGVFIGFFSGFITRDVFYRRRNMSDTKQVESISRRKFTSKIGWPQLLGVIIALLALLSTLAIVDQSSRYNAASDCLAFYVQEYNKVLKDRDNIASLGRKDAREKTMAEVRMWRSFLDNIPNSSGRPATPEQRASSIQAVQQYFVSADAYLAALDRSDQARLSYPIPDNRCPQPRSPQDPT